MTTSKLSPSTFSELLRLEAAQNDYYPNDEIAEQLRSKSINQIVGPTCTGKSTVMGTVVHIDGRYAIAGTLTSREYRADTSGKRYHYISHDDEGLLPLFDKIHNGEVVQYAVHPFTKRVYATELEHYPTDFSLLDVLSNAVANFHRLPFKASPVIGLVVEPNIWSKWADERFPPGNPDRDKRLSEADSSLTWLLAQPGNDVHWVENISGRPEAAARVIIDIALGRSVDNYAARALAESMLSTIHNMLH